MYMCGVHAIVSVVHVCTEVCVFMHGAYGVCAWKTVGCVCMSVWMGVHMWYLCVSMHIVFGKCWVCT